MKTEQIICTVGFIFAALLFGVVIGIGFACMECRSLLLRLCNLNRNIYYKEFEGSVPLRCRLYYHEFGAVYSIRVDVNVYLPVRACSKCGIVVDWGAFEHLGNFLKRQPVIVAALEELPKYLTDDNYHIRKMAKYRVDKLSRSK